MANASSSNFTFNVSLSVLDHLGRNLYRSFVTVLGEAISNSWDAGAENVWIEIDREASTLLVKDDGQGMSPEEFQNKFLRIGYSKRQDDSVKAWNDRPFIGRKGIGKLALLSCADKISVMTRTTATDYVGGVIDNNGLSAAISHDLTPDQYPLLGIDATVFGDHVEDHTHGTLIYFEGIKEGIRNTVDFIKKTVALYFRFSLLDKSFRIHVNGDQIGIDSLSDLQQSTEFLWVLNDPVDPFIQDLEKSLGVALKEKTVIDVPLGLNGFIASVRKPRDLTIMGMGDRVSVDLYVNGRVRERDIIKHIPTSRITENYLYGQIHYNDMDDDVDRFTSSREGVVADDPMFKELLKVVQQNVLGAILSKWDEWRRKYREDGDKDNTTVTTKDRKSEELFNAVAAEYESVVDKSSSVSPLLLNNWLNDLSGDAQLSYSSFAECFVSENLLRKLIEKNGTPLTKPAIAEVTDWRKREAQAKVQGNINIDVRRNDDDLNYLGLTALTKVIEPDNSANNLNKDAKEYKPMRDAIMHTALLTEQAKKKLSSVADNVQARVKKLLSS